MVSDRRLQVGNRVEHVLLGCKGTVVFAMSSHVRVRWDDGKLGILYFDGSTPSANLLQRLKAR